MTKQRSADEAMKALSDAQEAVIQDGGVYSQGRRVGRQRNGPRRRSKESMVERLKQARAEPYKPRGAWMGPRG
jgi:hypothetical protein